MPADHGREAGGGGGRAPESGERWHAFDAGDIARRLGSRWPEGLEEAEAAARLAQHGPNELAAEQRTSAWALLLAQFRSVLIVILLVATGISALLGHGLEAAAIAVIVVFSALLGFVQEFRAERAMESLRRMAAPLARVRRGGLERSVPAAELVPGDVVLLDAGARVPADMRLLEVCNLQADEAALTGESLAVDKTPDVLPDEALPVGDRHNMAHAGIPVFFRDLIHLGAGRADAGQVGGRREVCFLDNAADSIKRALAGAAAGAIGHGHKVRV